MPNDAKPAEGDEKKIGDQLVGGIDMSKFMYQGPKTEQLDKLATGEEEHPAVKGQEAREAPSVDVSKLKEHEQVAYKKGWRPDAVWAAEGNDPDDWRNAKQFLEHGDHLNSMHKMKRQIRRLTDGQVAMKQWNEEAEKSGYDKAIKELKIQRRDALKESDTTRVLEIDGQIDELGEAKEERTKERKAALSDDAGTSPDEVRMATWIDNNDWFNYNPFLRGEAIEIVSRAEKDGDPLDVALERVDTHIATLRKNASAGTNIADDDEEDGKTTPRARAAPKVARTRSPQARGGSVLPKRSELPEDAMTVYDSLVKTRRNPQGMMEHDVWMKQYLDKGGPLVTGEGY